MLIAFAGLSGAGKSTAIAYLAARGFGTAHYAGLTLLEELDRRGLQQTPDNERIVREELRASHGMAVFAERALPALKAGLTTDRILLDAVYCPEERDCYLDSFGDDFVILSIMAPFEIRAKRLLARADRPITQDKLAARDALELEQFRLSDVLESASHTLTNVGNLHQFEQALDDLRLRLG
jgi:dephospho-CoA kinase